MLNAVLSTKYQRVTDRLAVTITVL